MFILLQDFDVHGIAPRAVSTKDEFTQKKQQQQGVKRAASDVHHAVIPGEAALQSLVVPAHSTVGAKLLRALGWREGEGLGPKQMKYGPRQGLHVAKQLSNTVYHAHSSYIQCTYKLDASLMFSSGHFN